MKRRCRSFLRIDGLSWQTGWQTVWHVHTVRTFSSKPLRSKLACRQQMNWQMRYCLFVVLFQIAQLGLTLRQGSCEWWRNMPAKETTSHKGKSVPIKSTLLTTKKVLALYSMRSCNLKNSLLSKSQVKLGWEWGTPIFLLETVRTVMGIQ